jgi:hypothetical protein
MKRLVISVALLASAFIFTSCATNDAGQASSSPQVSPYAPPNNEAVYEDEGFNHWPQTFNYPVNAGPDAEP